MNKILLTIAGLAAGLTALAQGTVNLNNNYIPTGAGAKAFILGVSGSPLQGGTVEVWSGTTLLKSGAVGAAANTAGLFFLGVTEIPGVPTGGSGSIVIRSWDNASGTSWDTAQIRAETIVSLTGLGGGTTPTPGLGVAGNFTGLQLQAIPEPSTVALAALGLVGLLFVARRK